MLQSEGIITTEARQISIKKNAHGETPLRPLRPRTYNFAFIDL